MSIFSHFYMQSPGDFLDENMCDCLGGGGGDGGAAARAEADQAARAKKIKGNISLINLLFKNDPAKNNSRIEELKGERDALRPSRIPGALTGATPFFHGITSASGIPSLDPDRQRRSNINTAIQRRKEAKKLLTGPTKVEREASAISDVENFFFDDLNEQKADAERLSRFELARRGGTGGSQDLDTQERFQRKEDKARLDIGNVALDARNNLRSQDEELRAALIGQANAGLDRDVLTGDFINSLDNSLQRSRDTAKLTRFDPFFQEAGNLFTNVELARGIQTGRNQADDRLQSFFSADPKRNFGTVRN